MFPVQRRTRAPVGTGVCECRCARRCVERGVCSGVCVWAGMRFRHRQVQAILSCRAPVCTMARARG